MPSHQRGFTDEALFGLALRRQRQKVVVVIDYIMPLSLSGTNLFDLSYLSVIFVFIVVNRSPVTLRK